MRLSTHVLDAVTGCPAVGLAVNLSGTNGETIVSAETDGDGRIRELATDLAPGVYRLGFDTERYLGADAFFPEVLITFRIADDTGHVHLPVVLTPFAYSTYRGV